MESTKHQFTPRILWPGGGGLGLVIKANQAPQLANNRPAARSDVWGIFCKVALWGLAGLVG